MTGDHRTVNEKTGSNEQRFKMGGRKKKSRAFRLIGSLVLVGVLAFAGLVGFICIREGKVPTLAGSEYLLVESGRGRWRRQWRKRCSMTLLLCLAPR